MDLNSCKKIKSLTSLLHYFNAHLQTTAAATSPLTDTYITPYLHVSAANTHLWYLAAGIRSNKIRTAGADDQTGQQRSSPLHPKAGGTSLDEIHDPPLSQ